MTGSATVSKTNQWNLLKNQFDELVHDKSMGADSLFDAEFQRRFAELITRTAGLEMVYRSRVGVADVDESPAAGRGATRRAT
jgi:hypothetical protein